MDEIQQARIEIGKAQNIPPEQVPQRQAEQRVLAQKIASSKTQLSVSVAPTPASKPQSSVFIPSVPVAPTDNIVTDTGEMVDKTTFNALSPEDQSLLKAVGVTQYNALKGSQIGEAYEKEIGQYVLLENGEYFPRASKLATDTDPGFVGFDDMSLYDQYLLKAQGVDGFNKIKQDEFLQANLEVRPGEYINRVFFEALPENEQGFIRTQGVEAYNTGKQAEYAESQALFNRAIQWMSVDDEGNRIINIVDAIDKGGFTIEELKKLEITDEQIRAAYNAEPGFNTIVTAPEEQSIGLSQPELVQSVTPQGKVGGHEVFEELIPYTNETGSQVNAVQYLVDTKLDPNSVKVLEQVVSEPIIQESVQTAEAVVQIQDAGGVVELTRAKPNEAPAILAQAGYDADTIQDIQSLASVPPQEEPKSVWEKLGSVGAFGEFLGETAEQLKQNLIDNFTGAKADYWRSPEGQAELAAQYTEQQKGLKTLGDWGRALLDSGDTIYYDKDTGLYSPVVVAYIPLDISPAGGLGSKSQQLVSKVARNIVKLDDAADIGYSQAKFTDFLRARIEMPNLTPAEFDKLDNLKLSKILSTSKAAMTDIEVWARTKDLNRAWNQIVLRRLMDKVLAEQQQSAKLAAAARELKATGQVTLITPQISSLGVKPLAVVLISGKAAAPAVIETIDAVSQLASSKTQSIPAPAIQSVPTIQPVPGAGITPQTQVGTGTQTVTAPAVISTDIGITPQTQVGTGTQTVTAPAVISTDIGLVFTTVQQPMPTTVTQVQTEITPQPLPDLGIGQQIETGTAPGEISTSIDTGISPVPSTTTQTIPTPENVPAPAPQPSPQPSPQPQPAPDRVTDKTRPGDKLPPAPPRVVLPDEDKTREQWDEEYTVDGAVAWKQGFGWWVIRPPYRGKEDMHFFYGAPPEGVKAVQGGAKSAFESIQAFGGEVPENLVVDLGIQNITISNPSGVPGAGEIKYSEDTAQSKKWAREPYGRRTLSDETENAPERRITARNDAKARRSDTIEIEESGRYYLGRKLPDNIDIL